MTSQRFVDFASQIPETQVMPTREELEKFAAHQNIPNELGNPLFHSRISARSAPFTHVLTPGDEENKKIIDQVFEHVNPENYILMKLQIGQSEEIKLSCSFLVDKSNANIALMLGHNFFHRAKDSEVDSDIKTLYVPDFFVDGERRVIVDPEERITYVLGIDYYGEAKMSLLRMAMQIMREDRDGLGLHAGSKVIKLLKDGKVKDHGMLIYGLSGTGKTTLTCHDHHLKDPEGVVILQDDINLITSDGRAYGTEAGFYVKCDSFPEHELLTRATTRPGNILENVYVDENGKIDWKNFSISANTRAVVSRDTIDGTADYIDLPELNFILYNTRRAELPPIGRLVNPLQSAGYYGLGESIITSAEDASRAGEAKRVVGFDPFILGEKSKNINRMADIIANVSNLQSFVVNTGYVGDESNNIGVEDTSYFLEAALRGNIEWELDEDLGYEVPKTVNGKPLGKFSPREYYGDTKYKQLMADLRKERKAFLNQYTGIREEIVNSI